MAKKKTSKINSSTAARNTKGCMSCGCPCWRSDVRYCWDPEVPSFYTKDYVGAGISISS